MNYLKYFYLNINKNYTRKYLSSLKYPGFNQVIISKGKTISKESLFFFPLAINYSKKSLNSSLGISRYDILRDIKEPSSFLFMEVYNGPNIFEKQVESEHFEEFTIDVESYLEEPFDVYEYKSIYPYQDGWDVYQPNMPEKLENIEGKDLVVVAVTMHVKTEYIENFIQITSKHCDDSLQNHYSNFLNDQTLPTPSPFYMRLIQSCLPPQNIFQLYLYTDSEESLNKLRQTSLYTEWTESISPLLEKPRKSRKYTSVYSPVIRGEKIVTEDKDEDETEDD